MARRKTASERRAEGRLSIPMNELRPEPHAWNDERGHAFPEFMYEGDATEARRLRIIE